MNGNRKKVVRLVWFVTDAKLLMSRPTLSSKSPLKEIETCGYETLVPELCNV